MNMWYDPFLFLKEGRNRRNRHKCDYMHWKFLKGYKETGNSDYRE